MSFSSVVFPTPLRPTSPVRSAPKLRSRLEKSGLPSGVDQPRLERVIEADMKMDSPEGKTTRRCCRAEIHYCTHPLGIGDYSTGNSGNTANWRLAEGQRTDDRAELDWTHRCGRGGCPPGRGGGRFGGPDPHCPRRQPR